MGRDEQFIRLVRESARLNARPWSEVRSNYVEQPTNEGPGGDPGSGGGGDGGGSGDGGGDPDDGGEEITQEDARRFKAEAQRLARERAETEKQRRQREKEQQKEREKTAAEQGQYKDLAESRQTRIEELETEIEGLKTTMKQGDQRRNVERNADELGFKKPKRAWAILMDELGDEFEATVADDTLLREKLRTIARNEPELVDQQRRSGVPGRETRRNGQGEPDVSGQHNELVASLFNRPQL